MSTTAALPSKVDPNNINRAVKSLLKWWDSKSKSQNSEPLENDGFVYLTVTMKKIPQVDRTNPIMIPLPHPLIDLVEDSPELCLIIDDRRKQNKITKEAALKKIEAEKIPISNVIKVSKLKSDLLKLEPKRFELYFADRRLMPNLPKLFGKGFVKNKKKKCVVGINIKHGNWKEQIEKGCESALFFVGTGTCSVIKVAKLSMGKKEIAENVMAAINGIGDSVPGKWKNVKLFHLKLLESLALPLPLYQSVPDTKVEVI